MFNYYRFIKKKMLLQWLNDILKSVNVKTTKYCWVRCYMWDCFVYYDSIIIIIIFYTVVYCQLNNYYKRCETKTKFIFYFETYNIYNRRLNQIRMTYLLCNSIILWIYHILPFEFPKNNRFRNISSYDNLWIQYYNFYKKEEWKNSLPCRRSIIAVG